MAIYNLEKDVRALEEFAMRCPVQNLVDVFSELRQFVSLFLSGDVESFADEDIRKTMYPHLNKDKMIK